MSISNGNVSGFCKKNIADITGRGTRNREPSSEFAVEPIRIIQNWPRMMVPSPAIF